VSLSALKGRKFFILKIRGFAALGENFRANAPSACCGVRPKITNFFTFTAPIFGKYGCTASKYRNGSYEYVPRGSFVIFADGKYTYNGFEEPSKGTFTVAETGAINFKGGYLNGGEATPIDRPNKFFLVFPTIPDNRWTCGLVDDK
ncbi:MAG TPA: hypothetical protein VNI84_00405, partial [Pyrinomonadaceae bacterium]|nr:hypothetical protein [Pyrinomonadaceae bacterium]